MIRRSLLLILVVTAGCFAQLGEISVSLGTTRARNNSLGTSDPTQSGGDFLLDTNFRLGFRITVNNQSHFGHEFGYAYNRAKLTVSGQQIGMPIHQGIYNFLLYATKEGAPVRPYATGGVHFSSFYPPGASVFSGNGVTKFGFNYGGGVKFKVSEVLMMRLDVRDYAQGKPDFGQFNIKGMLHLLEVSAGMAFVF